MRRVMGPAGYTLEPRMLPQFTRAMSVPASSRMASATTSPMFVSDDCRCALTASSGTRDNPTTRSSSVPSRVSYDATTSAVRGSSGIALVIGSSS